VRAVPTEQYLIGLRDIHDLAVYEAATRAIMYERTTCPATIGQGVRMILMIVAEPSSTHVELTSTALLCIMLGTPER
jgi:hypothetical protein